MLALLAAGAAETHCNCCSGFPCDIQHQLQLSQVLDTQKILLVLCWRCALMDSAGSIMGMLPCFDGGFRWGLGACAPVLLRVQQGESAARAGLQPCGRFLCLCSWCACMIRSTVYDWLAASEPNFQVCCVSPRGKTMPRGCVRECIKWDPHCNLS